MPTPKSPILELPELHNRVLGINAKLRIDLNQKYEIVNIFVIQCQRAIGDEGYIEACIQAAGVD